MKDGTTDRAHEIWSAAQLAPGEGIEDGVARIAALLALPAPAMDSGLTRAQFALQALVSAGLVSQFKVDQALALFPAPAGEPEMPALPEWMTCESRRPWVVNSLRERAKELRSGERSARAAFRKDYMAVPARYFADALSDAAAALEARLLEIDVIRAAAPPQGEQTCSTKRA